MCQDLLHSRQAVTRDTQHIGGVSNESGSCTLGFVISEDGNMESVFEELLCKCTLVDVTKADNNSNITMNMKVELASSKLRAFVTASTAICM